MVLQITSIDKPNKLASLPISERARHLSSRCPVSMSDKEPMAKVIFA